MNKFEQGIVTAAKDTLKVIESPITLLMKTEKVIATAIVDQPELKAVVTTLAKDGIALGAKVAIVVSEKGLSLIDDSALVSEIQEFFTTDINQDLVPVVEKVYEDVKADLTAPPATAAVASATLTAVKASAVDQTKVDGATKAVTAVLDAELEGLTVDEQAYAAAALYEVVLARYQTTYAAWAAENVPNLHQTATA